MKHYSGKLRIIGGKHKGRNIIFQATDSLRPTADRIRETLFNWLAPYIEDSRCLDLFAGSGALGLEALSRGAKNVVFVESSRKTAEILEKSLAKIDCNANVICQKAITYLEKCNQKFDVIFLDPPYKSDLSQKSIDAITKRKLIKNNGWVYVEHSLHSNPLIVPNNWLLHRSTKAGDAKADLYKLS